jgi:glycosyltransferase involved in cell wall biosynthesis
VDRAVSAPRFSVVVPTHARAGQLARCLEALAALDYPRPQFEVIVVEDGGDGAALDLRERFRDRLDLTVLQQPRRGAAAARNAGASRARGEYLVFTDDDCAPPPEWLRVLATRLDRAPRCAVGGRALNGLRGNLCAEASHLLIDYLLDYFNPEPNDARFLTSNNLAFPAEGFRSVGGFDASFPRAGGEDRELCDRWKHHGLPLVFAHEWAVWHAHDLTLSRFWRQHWNYGRGAFGFHRRRAERGESPVRLEPSDFYLNLLRYPASQSAGRRALPLALLLALSQVANAAGFFAEKFAHAARGPKSAGQVGGKTKSGRELNSPARE